MIRTIAIAAAALSLASAASGQDLSQCRSLADDKARLACFDSAVPKATSTAIIPSTAENRSAWATQVERNFLKGGSDMSVMSLEAPDKTGAFERDKKRYPMLVVFAYFGKPFVYQAVAETKFLENARNLGFRTVDFFSRSSEGHWLYDLPAAGPLPRCDRNQRLCH